MAAESAEIHRVHVHDICMSHDPHICFIFLDSNPLQPLRFGEE